MAQMLMTSWGQTSTADEATSKVVKAGECLSDLIDAVAQNVPEVDAQSHKQFLASLATIIKQTPDRLQEPDKVKAVQMVVHELERHHKTTEDALKEQLDGWRGVVKSLVRELAKSAVSDAEVERIHRLKQRIPTLATNHDLEAFSEQLDTLLHTDNSKSKVAEHLHSKAANLSTANDNAAGLRGGGAAVAHLQRALDRAQVGFVAVFQLSCLNVIGERFGEAAVEDCLMAVSAFLTQRLESGDDAVYHWNDTTLLAIIEGRKNQGTLSRELDRIASQNRDITVNIAGRTVLLRIPLAFELTPISGFRSADDLYKLSR